MPTSGPSPDRIEELIANAIKAAQMLADEIGREREGRPLAVTAATYQRSVAAAQDKRDAGQHLTEREAVLAAAPRMWWLNNYAGGYRAICIAARLTPRWRPQQPEIPDEEQGEYPPPLPPVYRAIEEYHPPTPPTIPIPGGYYDTVSRRHVPAREVVIYGPGRRPLPPPNGNPAAWLAALPDVVTAEIRTVEREMIR